MKTKKIKWIILSVIAIGGIIVVVITASHPFFRSPKRIMSDTLKLTPMGMHIDDVAEIVKSRTIVKNVEEWREPTINYESGYVDPFGEVPGWPTTATSHGYSIVGHKSIRVYYSAYVGISIYWGFDEEGKLIDVLVSKNFDMIHGGHIRRTAD